MDSGNFGLVAESLLQQLADALETRDPAGKLDVECQQGVLTVQMPDGRTFVANRHEPTQQIWLSSPVSGAHYFTYDEESGKWVEQGKELPALLMQEVQALAG